MTPKPKTGYSPLPPEVTHLILKHIRRPSGLPPPGQAVHVLDPCAGEGVALAQIAQHLTLPPASAGAADAGLASKAYAIELNAARAGQISGSHSEIKLLGPCGFATSTISAGSFGMVYMYPPMEDEYGGGMEELSFLRRAIPLLVPGGVLCLVCQSTWAWGNRLVGEVLDSWFDRLEIYLVPREHRRRGEVVVLARKREAQLDDDRQRNIRGTLSSRGIRYTYTDDRAACDNLPVLGQPAYEKWLTARSDKASVRAGLDVWDVPWSRGPGKFVKSGFTDIELLEALAKSPLYDSMLSVKMEPELKRPPMSLNEGHTSLLLLSGLLDGYVPSSPPHVVRGHLTKVEVLREVKQRQTASGVWVEKRTYTESPVPLCRAVWQDGVIHTFGEPVADPEAQVALSDEDEEEEA